MTDQLATVLKSSTSPFAHLAASRYAKKAEDEPKKKDDENEKEEKEHEAKADDMGDEESCDEPKKMKKKKVKAKDEDGDDDYDEDEDKEDKKAAKAEDDEDSDSEKDEKKEKGTRKAERRRIMAIMTCQGAAKNLSAAIHYAFETDKSSEEVIDMLDYFAPKEATHTVEKKSSSLRDRMSAEEIPAVGPGDNIEPNSNQAIAARIIEANEKRLGLR